MENYTRDKRRTLTFFAQPLLAGRDTVARRLGRLGQGPPQQVLATGPGAGRRPVRGRPELLQQVAVIAVQRFDLSFHVGYAHGPRRLYADAAAAAPAAAHV